MKNRRFMLGALLACLVLTAALAATLAAAKPAKKQAAFKVAWIYPGPYNDGGWSTAHDAGRKYAEKVLGAKIQTTYKDKVFSNASVPQIVAGLVRDGYQMIFGTSFGQFELGVNGQLYAKYPKVLFEQATGTQIKPNQSEYFGAAEDTIYLSGMAAGAATEEGRDRLHRPLRHPRGRPAPQRLHARRAGDPSGREGEDHLDERVVLPAEGDGRRQGARRRRRRRARPERRQPRRPASTPRRPGSRGSATTPTRRSSRRSSG